MEEIDTKVKDLSAWASKVEEQLQLLDLKMEKQILRKEDLINRLHDELDYYKKDSAERFENQLLKAVIKVRLDMRRNLSSDKFLHKSAEELLEAYRYIFEDLTDLLELQNCDEFESSPGAAFDPEIHQAKVEPTTQSALNKTVKASMTPGFRKCGKTLIPERVLVYNLSSTRNSYFVPFCTHFCGA